MKYLKAVLKYFLPMADDFGERAELSGAPKGEKDEASDPAADPAGGDPGDSVDPAKPLGGSDPEGRPDWLPEKFWNPDLKAPRAEVMAKSFTELEGKFREKTDVLKDEIRAEMRASAPESYEVKLSEDLELPDNIELDLNNDDPLISWFSGFAKEKGLSQEDFDTALNQYVKIEMANMPDMTAEIGKLGDHGQDRMLRVHNWLEAKLSADEMGSLSPLLNSATQIEALEKLMKSSGPADFDGDAGGDSLTLEELRTMQADKRYWQDKDPAFIRKVEDGYKRLYKNQ